ncbi:sigma-54-dependent transcriptional regulator [Sorangium sp. So ce1000]|uniref:sigma-54-dependent transcriptional regulator n=1 Tax=Sorangium sp. So ce1000 TaxID=3133325 RepID=UPI003F6132CE
MTEKMTALLATLARTTTFDEAATATLRAMLATADEALRTSPFAARGKLLRAMAHLRPADGYRQLTVVEHAPEPSDEEEPESAPEPEAAPSYLPSATAWRWVAEHRCAVSIDVQLRQVKPHAQNVGALVQKGIAGEPFNSKESRQRLLGRQATHVHALPLRMPGGSIDGMISLEANCRPAMGRDFIWLACTERLQLLADLAAPYLAALPLGPVAASAADEFLPVIGPTMASTVEMLRVFAQQEETILLSGPTGAGKSRLARWCKEQSRRKGGAFESLDLVTVPEDLQMAELFGWKRGAFTGALRDNSGYVARAQGGTLFIDEVDKLSMRAQAGLLHLLEERSYRPLGEGAGERRADVRFLVGTNTDLHRKVQEGRFREDLYYRINVLPIKVPPLDARADEIPLWAAYMLERRHRETCPDGTSRLDPEAHRALVQHRWPGNLRQLDNIVRRAYTLALLSHGAAPREVLLHAEHVERALDYEASGAPRSPTELLQEAAQSFVLAASQREGGLDLDLGDAFKGFVLGAAIVELGSREDAFRLFGRGALVESRNHYKTLKRELEKVEALYRALGQEGRFPFRALLDG